MNTVPLKSVTIVAEAVLEDRLLRQIHELGARGHTLSEVRGEGSRGVRASEWVGKNIKVQTIVSAEVADRILSLLAAEYFPHYAVIAYVETVEVVRGDKYV
jgi:nitrogen regulatory protein P-II 2